MSSSSPHHAFAMARLSNWNCFFGFQLSGECGDSDPTGPPLAPAAMQRFSTTRTTAPLFAQAQATASPNIPAPRISTSGIAIPCSAPEFPEEPFASDADS